MIRFYKKKKKVITFKVFDDSHTANNIYMMLKTNFEEYKINNKIFAISFDNASNNIAAIP